MLASRWTLVSSRSPTPVFQAPAAAERTRHGSSAQVQKRRGESFVQAPATGVPQLEGTDDI
jgi:hypothetical protein